MNSLYRPFPFNPFIGADFYKTGHPPQYPDGTEVVYDNFTPRKSRIPGVEKVVFFGLQYFIKEYLIDWFDREFFALFEDQAVESFQRYVDAGLREKNAINYDHIRQLHRLGYLPIRIKALPEGARVPIGVPALTIVNTHKSCFWLPNELETLLSTTLWLPCNSATIADQYKQILSNFAIKTTVNGLEFVPIQGHDFSMRGMGGLEAAMMSGAGHLLSFVGTDTIPALYFMEKYYNANVNKEYIGGSVPATEHSVMCAGEKDSEIETFRRLITKVYPKGIISIVSDTWDLWKVCTEYLTILKEEVLARDGKVVIRPDSGDPVDIICGTDLIGKIEYCKENGIQRIPSEKGVIELLWDIFGGTVNEKGYKELDPHIGAIYGDSITKERAKAILERLEAKGFASTNIVFGIGSFTYQYNTRDTLGWAMKATYVEVNGVGRAIFKDPVTDDGTKKSARGLLQVYKDENGEYKLKDNCTWEEEAEGELQVVYENGVLIKDWTLQEVRDNLKNSK